MVLKTTNLHKTYGKLVALNNLNLAIEKGQIFGLLGPNGSGKSTALGILLGVTNRTSGDFSWFGESSTFNPRKKIGAILEKPNFYENYSAQRNLEITCQIKEIPYARIEEELKRVGLFERRNDSFRTYSLGMKQRLAIASALLSDPDVLILDEPTNGLDPQGISEIRELILSIAKSGKTIILASHLLDEVQKVCTHFGILRKGSLIHVGTVDQEIDENITLEVGSDEKSKLEELIKSMPGYISHKLIKKGLEVKMDKSVTITGFHAELIKNDIITNHLVSNKKTLEQQFLEILEAND